MAHAIARVVYRMLKYRVDYEPLSLDELRKVQRTIDHIHKKKDDKPGLQPVPNQVPGKDNTRRPRFEDALFAFYHRRDWI
jgi:hypothetical protein